jgi:drug/metabolite transporter (DMT)-like permease
VFAMSPFVIGLMTWVLLKHNPFSVRRVMALLLALLGLIVIFHHQIQFGLKSAYGIAGILLSCFLFGFSSVLVKKLNVKVDAFNQAIGAMLFALPGLLLMWWYLDGHFPANISMKSLAAIGYLSVFGSLIGAALFFYVLAKMSPTAVSLITFMTPVLALILGAWVAHETLGLQLWLGAGLVVLALLLYLDLSAKNVFFRRLRKSMWREDPLLLVKSELDKFK